MKKLFLLLLATLAVYTLDAQEQGELRVGFNAGLAIPYHGRGLSADMDIRYNITDNFNAGVKAGLAAMIREINDDYLNFNASGMGSINTSALITGDYYLNKGTSNFAPFVGGGLGCFSLINIYVSAYQQDDFNINMNEFNPDFTFGGLLRGGFELSKLRVALEFYLIPYTTLYDVNLEDIGRAANSYVNLSVGFYIGGGSWRKKTATIFR